MEWIDEDPILPLSPSCAAKGSRRVASLESEFKSLIKSRRLCKPLTTVTKLLQGRGLGMRTTHVTKIRLGLPKRETKLLHQDSDSFRSVRGRLHVGKSSVSLTNDDGSYAAGPRSTTHYMPRGLAVLPEGRLLPLALFDITTQATRNLQLVLGAAEAIWSRRLSHDPTANRAEFEKEIWEYERCVCLSCPLSYDEFCF